MANPCLAIDKSNSSMTLPRDWFRVKLVNCNREEEKQLDPLSFTQIVGAERITGPNGP